MANNAWHKLPEYHQYVISSKSVNALNQILIGIGAKLDMGSHRHNASLYPLPCKCKCTNMGYSCHINTSIKHNYT